MSLFKVMLSTGGTVLINNCTFENNSLYNISKPNAVVYGGNRDYIETPYCGIRLKGKDYFDSCNIKNTKESNSTFEAPSFNKNLKPKIDYLDY